MKIHIKGGRVVDPKHKIDAVEDIFAALDAESGNPWCATQLETLCTKSPQTLKVALRQIRAGAQMA